MTIKYPGRHNFIVSTDLTGSYHYKCTCGWESSVTLQAGYSVHVNGNGDEAYKKARTEYDKHIEEVKYA